VKGCGLRRLTWYQATRHTFASQWVLNDRSIEKLAAVLGHSSTWVTERYAHLLRPDLFKERGLAMFNGAVGHTVGTSELDDYAEKMRIASNC
jgi:hypothetical protein